MAADPQMRLTVMVLKVRFRGSMRVRNVRQVTPAEAVANARPVHHRAAGPKIPHQWTVRCPPASERPCTYEAVPVSHEPWGPDEGGPGVGDLAV